MNHRLLILRSLNYYRGSYFATLAGVIISVAVITGALAVGDSVRQSLQMITEKRLGNTSFVVGTTDHFFRQVLSDSLGNRLNRNVSAVLLTKGVAINPEIETQLNNVQIVGFDSSFQSFWGVHPEMPEPGAAFISKNTAEKLQLETGDELLLRIRDMNDSPVNAPFASSPDTYRSIRLSVEKILDEEPARFGLESNQVAPYNIFTDISQLSRVIEMEGMANLLLVPGYADDTLTTEDIDEAVACSWNLQDAGIETDTSDQGYMQLTSRRIFMDISVDEAVNSAIPANRAYLTYLANTIRRSPLSTPYSFISATNDPSLHELKDESDILINSWLAEDLNARPGDSLTLVYYVIGPMRSLVEDSCTFRIAGIRDILDPAFDKNLMPDFPGMSEAGSCREWETSAPVKLDRIRDKDEAYWESFRGTPKAMILLEKGRKIWNNPFGITTMYRYTPDHPSYAKKLLKKLAPISQGFRISPVKESGLFAARNSTDFGGLFLSLSFFIIASGVLLTVLVFGLQVKRRTGEVATLMSLGFTRRKILQLFFTESAIVALSGSLVGTALGIIYNNVLVFLLNSVWQGAVGETQLIPVIHTGTLVIGFVAGVFISYLTLAAVLACYLRKPPSRTIRESTNDHRPLTRIMILSISVAFLMAALALPLGYKIFGGVIPAGISLGSGGLLLASILLCLYIALLSSVPGDPAKPVSLKKLIIRNLGFRLHRNIGAVTLLALGIFAVIITGANRKSFHQDKENRASGTGGFLLWAESTVPVPEDLNSQEGKSKYALIDEDILNDVTFLQLHRVQGEDASCLNLNMVAQPVLLGIQPQIFDSLKVFSFEKLHEAVDPSHPWLFLNREISEGILPAYADQTVITWGLQKKIGDTLKFLSESGKPLSMVLMGGIRSSVMQGHLLVSEKILKKYYPSGAIPNLFLLKGPFNKQSGIAERLEYLMGDYGFTATPPDQRLMAFNTVENTYLSVFMLLGGLGLVIGVVGIGVVLLKNTYERRDELALYRAIGWNRKKITHMLIGEHFIILCTGILAGTLSAIYGLIPVWRPGLPYLELGIILLLIFLSGMAWIVFPAFRLSKGDILGSLRNENHQI